MEVDFLIVGQGLAGSCLARTLLQRGQRVHVLDRYREDSASRVAAGMWNPVVFKRMTKAWQADLALPIATAFFIQWQKELELQVWRPTPILRVFPDQAACNDFLVRSESDGFSHHLDCAPHPDGERLSTLHGYGRVITSGYLELGVLLDRQRELWLKAGLCTEGIWDEALLNSHGHGFQYGDIRTKNLVLCQGYELLNGELFGHLPLRRTKGEVIDVTAETKPFSNILNNGRWAIPLANGHFRLGATYEWHTDSTALTAEARELLINRFTEILGDSVGVVHHRAGIRPTSKDRRPLLGTHPSRRSVHVFNGLGTRGVMIAPWLSEVMADYLIDAKPLPEEVDIRRF